MIDARELIEDGVEFRAVRVVLERWLQKHNLETVKQTNGWWSMYADGRPFADFDESKYPFPTYHEMLEDLLGRLDYEALMVDANMEENEAQAWTTVDIPCLSERTEPQEDSTTAPQETPSFQRIRVTFRGDPPIIEITS